MFKKIGDLQSIIVINPVDVDDDSTKKLLDNTIKNVEAQTPSNQEKIDTVKQDK
jgi:hypothetical protein